MTPEYITVHNTANDASAASEVNYMINNTNEVSFHYAVDDKEIVQGISETRNTWNAGDGNGKGNRASLSIEICYSLSGGEKFLKAEKNAAEFIACLLKQYGWDINHVKKHQDWNGKYCPHRTLDMGWSRFLNMIQKFLGSDINHSNISSDTNTIVTENGVDVFYRVRTKKHGWLPEVKNLEDFAGFEDRPVTDIAVRVSKGRVKYRVHQPSGWLPFVTGYNICDSINGYAGDGQAIDAIEIYYLTPEETLPYKRAKYRVAPAGQDYYPWQYDNEISLNQDGYAGDLKNKIGKVQIVID